LPDPAFSCLAKTMTPRPVSLQQRTFLFILLPTFLLLLILSVGGFLFVRNVLMEQWGQMALSKLQHTAHLVDMRLIRLKEMLLLLQTENGGELSLDFAEQILERVEKLEGVVRVEVDWPGGEVRHGGWMGMMRGYRLEPFTISPPNYNTTLQKRTVAILSRFTNGQGEVSGRVAVFVSFDALTERIVNAQWWHTSKAYLLDDQGNVLVSTGVQSSLEDYYPMRAFGTISSLERDTLAALAKTSSGTVLGPGQPPKEISGFYRLVEAPWTLVIIAPGNEVLQPIIRFKYHYFSVIVLAIITILLFIRATIGKVTLRIKELSGVADKLAGGIFGPPVAVTSSDEVGDLTRSFNKMSRQLRQRLALKEALDLAREVQQNLLPTGCFAQGRVMVCGRSLYCEETGGDYFDILEYPENQGKIGVAVGDVVGHGIGAALLMTTLRALLRCRISTSGRADEIISSVNRLLCLDTQASGSFATLFYLEIDPQRQLLSWVRGGHDPAVVYSPARNSFFELKGRGLALGVDDRYRFEYNERPLGGGEQLILIASDGAWEVENHAGECFGKERLKALIAAHSSGEPERLIEILFAEIKAFRAGKKQHDDITLAVIKTW
jgi:phosphoserine phosphatase RsbU/P